MTLVRREAQSVNAAQSAIDAARQNGRRIQAGADGAAIERWVRSGGSSAAAERERHPPGNVARLDEVVTVEREEVVGVVWYDDAEVRRRVGVRNVDVYVRWRRRRKRGRWRRWKRWW